MQWAEGRLWLQVLLKELQAGAYSDGLRDQNAVIYLLKTHPEWQDRVMFQDKEICLNCYWQDLIGVTGYGKPSFDRVENVCPPHPTPCSVSEAARPLPHFSAAQHLQLLHDRASPSTAPERRDGVYQPDYGV